MHLFILLIVLHSNEFSFTFNSKWFMKDQMKYDLELFYYSYGIEIAIENIILNTISNISFQFTYHAKSF